MTDPTPAPEIDKIARDFLNRFFPETWAREERGNGSDSVYAVDAAELTTLADHLLLFIAEVLANIMDVGSEREATLENEELRTQIIEELKGWTW